MTLGIIIPVRYDSSRLPGKALIKIKEKPVISYIYERLETTSIDKENIVFATSDEKSDKIIEEFCKANSYKCFLGSKNNVALRFLNCAKYYNFDGFVRICGDNVFADKKIINKMLKIYKENNYDMVTNIPGRTFPYGISVEIVRTKFFENIYPEITDSSDREHVTKYIYEHAEKYNLYTYQSDNELYKDVHLALDTKEDFDIIAKIISRFKRDHREYDIDDIIDLYHSIVDNET